MHFLKGRKSLRRDFIAEAVEPTFDLGRRNLLAASCACCALAVVKPVRALAAADALSSTPTRAIHGQLDAAARAIEAKMIAWRRDIHANPELGNQELRTANLAAQHLRSLGYEVREKVAQTGVVAVLRGNGGPGPVVALRADMDALPVAEEVDVPFASKARAQWAGEEVSVMHACGHDCHVAILMAAAEVLAGMRGELRGTLKLLFQPAEEKLPKGEIGGARLMLEQGAFADPKPDVVFGLHVISWLPTGTLGYRPGATTASSDAFRIQVQGRQSHGATPWLSVDPIVIGSTIVSSLQTIISRETEITTKPAVLTVAIFKGGTRYNIIPDRAELEGTLRTFNEEQRQAIMRRVKDIAESTARGMNGTAEVIWQPDGYPPVVNDDNLTKRMAPTLIRVAGDRALVMERSSVGEDFSYFAQQVPGLFYFVGITPPDVDPAKAPGNHSPRFEVDEAGLILGLRATLHLVADYTSSGTG
jgi:amidohydrolase